MIDELKKVLPEYAGWSTHARCFLHMTNLIAKSLLRAFDIKKEKKTMEEDGDDRDELEKQIEELSEGLERDEQAMIADAQGSNNKEGLDDIEGLIDLSEEMDPRESMKSVLAP